MSIEDRKFNTVRSIGEECIKLDELKNLLAKKPEPIAYDGFEPSGRMHVAQVRIFHVLQVFVTLELHLALSFYFVCCNCFGVYVE